MKPEPIEEETGSASASAGAPSRTSLLIDRLRVNPAATVEDLVLAAYPEIAATEDPHEARKIRIRAVAVLTKLVERGKLVRLGRGRYALPAAKT